MALRSILTGSNAGGTGTSTSSVFTLAGTEVAGDVAVMLTWQATGSNSVSSAGGANLQSGPDRGSTVFTGYVYTKTLTSGDISTGSITIGWNGSGRMIEAGAVYSGVDETSIVVGTALVQTSSSTSITLPTVTTSSANDDVIHFYVGRVGSGTPATPSWPGGYTVDVAGVKSTNASGANGLASTAHLTSPGAAGSYGGGSVTYASTNTTGAWTVALPPSGGGPTNVTLTDTAAGADAVSVTAAASFDDPASGADVVTISATIPVADTGSGTDAVTASAAVPLGDTGTGSDALTTSATVPLADTATGADALTATVTAPLSDTAAGTESLTASVTVTLADAATAVDAVSVSTGSNPSLPDTAAAADALTATATTSTGDTAAATDALTLSAAVPLSDARTATDALTVTASTPLAELATAADALAVTVLASLVDVAHITDGMTHVDAGVTTPGNMRAGTATGPTMAGVTPRAAAMAGATSGAASMTGKTAAAASMASGTASGPSMRPA